ncbi:serine/threonine-protein kinase [Streptomyces sp. MB09-01]|uniref:serine/threonine-protein kinase n=1 Tax=Streptomyces sp. MB09-01 TaxID=3028666 RepID=UPI0029A2174C|nr:serine/threonine-protein kinase [Streptomyces sp. MB09-01]MDX3535755.1 serine/threonine-protein kinase [Streptomyces sp. MB09-01]
MNSATEVFEPLRAEDPKTVAGYRLAARLGAGGMGRVYLSHTPGGRPVAIKVVRPELAEDPVFRRRFRREVVAARRVRGAYTAEVIDADAEGTPPWLATLYVPGPSLSEAVAKRGPLPVPALLWLVAGIAEALQAIHAEGVVHRDLKPSNVLLAADGPRVIDFGISTASDTTAPTATGGTIGTPQYMAPEQALAGETTPATDVFALGQTVAYAALGEPLYGTGPSMTVLFRIVHSEPDLSRLPEQLRPLLARCLASDPEERATPTEIVEWCRQQLGEDADDTSGGSPAVWREVLGPEVEVPDPALQPATGHETPMVWGPTPQTPEERRKSRKRAAVAITAAMTVGTLVLGGLAWTVKESAKRMLDREASAARSPGPAVSASGSADAATPPTPSASQPPKANPYPALRLDDEQSSITLGETLVRNDRSGEIRMSCKRSICSLESDTATIIMLYGGTQGSLDSCRSTLALTTDRSWTLAGAAGGSQFCIRNKAGDVGLYVLQFKSTADVAGMPQWISGDLTVWRQAMPAT